MSLSNETRQQIEGLIRDHRILLFMKGSRHFPQCGFSATVVKILDGLTRSYHTVNVLADPAIREVIKEFSNWPTIPQLYINGEFIGGCDVVKDLSASGELQTLIGGESSKASTLAPPPSLDLTITDLAAEALRGAASDAGADVLRFAIDEEFQYDLFFGPKTANDVVAESNGIKVHLDRESATRANGTTFDFVPGAMGGFKITNPNEPARVRPLSATALKEMIDSGRPLKLIDVRTQGEWDIAHIEGAQLLDDALLASIEKLPHDTTLVFQCHHGMRSRSAAERYVLKGFKNVYNLEGGIEAWSTTVDPKVPRY
ncbi:MAG: Grx4 family monothiol glutaredoxin [Polyangiaceae bacterium]